MSFDALVKSLQIKKITFRLFCATWKIIFFLFFLERSISLYDAVWFHHSCNNFEAEIWYQSYVDGSWNRQLSRCEHHSKAKAAITMTSLTPVNVEFILLASCSTRLRRLISVQAWQALYPSLKVIDKLIGSRFVVQNSWYLMRQHELTSTNQDNST